MCRGLSLNNTGFKTSAAVTSSALQWQYTEPPELCGLGMQLPVCRHRSCLSLLAGWWASGGSAIVLCVGSAFCRVLGPRNRYEPVRFRFGFRFILEGSGAGFLRGVPVPMWPLKNRCGSLGGGNTPGTSGFRDENADRSRLGSSSRNRIWEKNGFLI